MGSHLRHGIDGLDVVLEVCVEELVLQPLDHAGRHLAPELLHILLPRGREVPLQHLRDTWGRVDREEPLVYRHFTFYKN